MSRWLPSGLSALSGQISSFTKEVLADGVEEIDDHVTELRTAKTRITELEGLCAAQKSELERVKQQNEELGVLLHSHELQWSSLSTQYRMEIDLKEKEIKALKHQITELSHHSAEFSAFTSSSEHSANVTTHDDAHSDEFGDIISSQREINNLRGEVRRLTAETQHWRRIASDNSSTGKSAVTDSVGQGSLNVSQMQAQIQELQNQLDNIVDRHQHELSTLQDAHRQTVATLKSNYSSTIDQLKKQLHDGNSVDKENLELHQVKEQLKEVELVRRKLETDLEHTHAADRKKADLIQELTKQKEVLCAEHENLTEQIRSLSQETQELRSSVHELSEERLTLMKESAALRQRCKELEQETELMKTASSHLDSSDMQSVETERFMASTPIKPRPVGSLYSSAVDVSVDYAELTLQNQQLDEQVRQLHGRIEAYEQELEQFELVKSDWQMEKESLEAVLIKLRSELREKEEVLSVVVARKDILPHLNASSTPKNKSSDKKRQGLIEAAQGQGQSVPFMERNADAMVSDDDDVDVETHAKRLDHQVELLTSGSALLEDERDRLLQENVNLLSELNEQRKRVSELEQQLARPSDVEQEMDDQKLKLQKQKQETSADVERSPLELNDEQQASSRQRETTTLSQNESLRQENDDLKSEIKQLKSEWYAEKKKLEENLEDLDTQHQQAVTKIVEKCDKLSSENKDLKQRTSELEATLSEHRNAKKFKDIGEDNFSDGNTMETTGDFSRTVATQAAEVARLSEVARVQALEVSHLREECQSLESDLKSRCEALDRQHKLIEAQQRELERLRGNISHQERTHGEQINQMADEIEILRNKEIAATGANASLQETLAKLRSQHSELENKLDNIVKERDILVADVSRLKHELDKVVNETVSETSTASSVSSTKQLLAAVQDENQTLKRNLEEVESVSRLYEAEVERLSAVEEQHNGEITKLHQEIDKLRNELQSHQETRDRRPAVAVENTSSDSESVSVTELQKLQSHLAAKEALLEDLTAKNRTLNEKVSKLNVEIESLKELLAKQSDVKGNDYLANGLVENHVTDNGAPVAVDGEKGNQSGSNNSSELSRLHSTIAHQKDLIDTLNSKYTSLLSLLDDRSKSVHGSSVLVDMHRLESEARELRADRERLVAVLGEKTREASALRNEVHRLTAATAATQAALAKTQQEAKQLAQGAANSREEVNQDMKSEAVKRLSQIIRDKDVEIEALKLKNSTLVQVLQDSAPDGSKVTELFGETDTLRSQLAVYQRDREQLISALTAKHQESVGFYEEAQRLATRVSELGVELEQRAQSHNSLAQQYEEKQRALYSALNELSTLRQRRTELERLLANRQTDLATASKDTTSRASFNMDSDDEETATTAPFTAAEGQSQELRQYKEAMNEKELAINERDQRIIKLEQAIADRERLMEERQQEFVEGAVKLRQLEETVSVRSSEMTSLRKQCESLMFDLQGAVGERSELMRERDALRQKAESLSTELQTLRSQYNELFTTVSKKDFELVSLKDQVSSLEKLVASTSSGGQHDGEVKMLMVQQDGLRRQLETLQSERDAAHQELHRGQTELVELKNKISQLSEREHRLLKECDRLRSHLVQTEDGYTREALEAEEREKQLRNRLAAAEEKMHSSSSLLQNARLDMAKQIESLQIQLHAMAEQRDNALFQLSSAQETITSYASSLSNLQMVLEQFQAERQQQQYLEIERYKRDAQREHEEAEKVRQEMRQMQTELDEAVAALEAAHRLSEQLDRKEAMISALREEVQLRESELMKAEEQVRKLTSSSEAKIDKIIIKNLLLGYFHTPPSKRQEALQVIGQILSYSREEMKEITSLNANSEGSWIGGFFRKKSSQASPTHSAGVSGNPYTSFSELFVKFLERESTPQPVGSAPRLPTDRMIQEQQEKQQQRRTTPAFNPFSAAVLNAAPPSLLTAGGTGFLPTVLPGDSSDQSQHPLMRPISPPHLPVFAAVSSDSTNALNVPLSNNADSSGRSTPLTPSAILRDLLQQR